MIRKTTSEEIYSYLVRSYRMEGFPPSIRRIQEMTGLRSTSAVDYHLKKLTRLGMVEMVQGHPVPVEIKKYLLQYTPKESKR